jgi:hypothetical protein
MRERERLIARIRQLRRVAAASDRPGGTGDPEPDRLQALERRIEHLERLVEGLQDSVHRESERHSKLIAELQGRSRLQRLAPPSPRMLGTAGSSPKHGYVLHPWQRRRSTSHRARRRNAGGRPGGARAPRVFGGGIRLMSSGGEFELAQADARYCRDRVALLRAKLYRWGLGSTPRLRELERELERAEPACATCVRIRRADTTCYLGRRGRRRRPLRVR